ncbi:FAD-binding oxidoreductase [Thermogymnomonas acidicola]|uniref:FAD-binding oxidoreductase n=1 Tax=Thermogymnomonas acidicola TaxID=399579 RepID=A0AA37F9D6_9ARCH|nr:FAD-binding oxidoreductase [Thermogymnomonas acidicola]GGM68492.1 FAD-binding oxidoreductase [Thermogymnomonas acidicola]
MPGISSLKAELGDAIITDEKEMIPYMSDASYFPGQMPEAVCIPNTVDQVSRILRFCNDNDVPVVVRGGGTSLTGASIPVEGSVVLSMARFDRILEIRTDDKYAVVEPGVRLDRLNSELSRYGHFYPPDPASSMAATVGGSISTNAGGLRAAMYGTTKNWVLGLEVVIPNGKVLWLGGKTLKRTSGYDLTALFVGSEGTLGVITKAVLKIWPLPEARGRISAYFDRIESVGLATAELKKRGKVPMIAEFLDRIAMDSLEHTRGIRFPQDAEYLLLVDIASTRESLKRELEEAVGIIGEFSPSQISYTTDREEMERMYAARKGAYSSLLEERKDSSERVIIGDVVVPASRLPEALRRIRDLIRERGFRASLFGHIGDGNIHINLYADPGKREVMEEVDRLQLEIGRIAVSLEGSVSAEHGIGMEKIGLLREELRMRDSEYVIDIMRAIKATFDPKGILNRGKVFP